MTRSSGFWRRSLGPGAALLLLTTTGQRLVSAQEPGAAPPAEEAAAPAPSADPAPAPSAHPAPGAAAAVAPVPTPSDAPPSGAAQTEDVSALLQDADPTAASSQTESMVRFYGFMDMGFFRYWMPQDSLIYGFQPTNKSSFIIGNINLYTDIHPSDNWDGLVEVRYSLQPHGQDEQLGFPAVHRPYQRTSTLVRDWYSPGGGSYEAQWGGIILERAYIDHTVTSWLTLRLGQFFTPYGIWNVDHGTPTLISLLLPQMFVWELFPARQTGLQAFGSVQVGRGEYGYAAYVSNGRTPIPVDFTEDKMVGGRLYARYYKPFALTVGASGFWGRNTDIEKDIVATDPRLVIQRKQTINYREGGLAGDVALDLGGFRFRAEIALRDVVYKAGRREPIEGVPNAFKPDRMEWGWYTLAAYQLPWWGLEPYLFMEQVTRPDELGLPPRLIAPSAGLNVHFTPAAQLKLQYGRPIWYFDKPGDDPHKDGFGLFQARVVLAF